MALWQSRNETPIGNGWGLHNSHLWANQKWFIEQAGWLAEITVHSARKAYRKKPSGWWFEPEKYESQLGWLLGWWHSQYMGKKKCSKPPTSSRKKPSTNRVGSWFSLLRWPWWHLPFWNTYGENPTKMDDLGVPPFMETSIWTCIKTYTLRQSIVACWKMPAKSSMIFPLKPVSSGIFQRWLKKNRGYIPYYPTIMHINQAL